MKAIPFNAWVLAVPLLFLPLYIAVRHRDATKRMADMSGNTRKEKAVTIAASLTHHLFMLLFIFIPLSSNMLAVVIGAPLYAIGLIGFVAAVASYIKAIPEGLATHGIYRITRNPMYVTALLVYAGMAMMTINLLLSVLLIVMIFLHHLMILSEERACVIRFGKQYEQYRIDTPRYLFL